MRIQRLFGRSSFFMLVIFLVLWWATSFGVAGEILHFWHHRTWGKVPGSTRDPRFCHIQANHTFSTNSAGIGLFKVNNESTRILCEICSKLTIKTSEWRHYSHSGVFTVNFEWIWHIALVFKLLTMNKHIPAVNLVHITETLNFH